MKVVWVYENITGLNSFYSKFNITLLLTSVCLWKKYHPKHKTNLYVDEQTYNKLIDLDVTYLWDNVRLLDYKDNINREKLWAGCKTKVISQTKDPMIMVDHDFLIFKNIDEYLNNEIIYSYDEDMSSWYIDSEDTYNKQLTTPIEFYQNTAANVSLLYLPDPIFAKEYGEAVTTNLKEFTALLGKAIHTGYLTICEQFLLKEWIVKRNLPHRPLTKNIYSCKDVKHTDELNLSGIWTLEESFLYYKHYGVDKRNVLDNRKSRSYDNTMAYLYNCIKASKLINIEYLDNKLNREIISR